MKKIYIMGDDEDFLRMIELILRKKYFLKSNREIAQTCDDLNHFIPDLILIDKFSSTKDSYKIISLISKTSMGKTIPFIFFSESQEAADLVVNQGAAGYILKPSSGREIVNYIDKFFEQLKDNDPTII